MIWLTLAGIAYLLAVCELFAAPRLSKRIVIIGLALAAIWHVVFLRLPAGADDDIHRYVWDGRLQRLGYNPYLIVPSDPAVAGLHTTETRALNNPDLPSLYPPGAQLFFRAVTAIHESTFALRVAFVICDFVISLILLDLLRTTGRAAHLVLAYAWNPLLAIEVAGSGHIDIVGALLLVISAAALTRSVGQAARLSSRTQSGSTATRPWRTIAALTFGLAVAVKFLPVVLLPLYWKRIRIRDGVFSAAVVALLYMPFLHHGRIPIGSLGTYVTGFRFNGPVFALFHAIAPPQLLAAVAVIAGLGTAAWLSQKTLTTEVTEVHREDATVFPLCNSVTSVVNVFAWPIAASLVFAPVVFPWYLLWLLPFLTSPRVWPLIVWTVSIIPVYFMWHLSSVTGSWGTLPSWIMALEYGCVAAAAAILALRTGPTNQSSTK